MARIAVAEDVEGLRDEQEMDDSDMGGDANDPSVLETETNRAMNTDDEPTEGEGGATPPAKEPKRKFVATIHEVNEAFDSLNTLRYSQPTHLQGAFLLLSTVTHTTQCGDNIGKCQGLTITPFSAGHTLGGAIWKIRSPSAGTIVYAVNLNHMKERHLDGTILLRPGGGSGVFEPLLRPDLLITDAERASSVSSRRKDRDAALLGTQPSESTQSRGSNNSFRLRDRDALLPPLPSPSMRFQHSGARAPRPSRPTLELLPPKIPDLPPLTNRGRNVDLRAEYDGMVGWDSE